MRMDKVAILFGAGREARSGLAASGELTWGQSHMWRPLSQFGEDTASFNVRRTLSLPKPVPEELAVDALRELVRRHQVLRSRFEVGPDGSPVQVVEESGVLAVDMVGAPEGGAERAALDTAARLAEHPFTRASGWRIALVREGGAVRNAAFVASRVAVDGWAIGRLLGEYTALLAGKPLGETWQPLDQARWESSAQGRAADARSMAYWAQRMAKVPPAVFRQSRGTPAADPFQYWTLRSPAVITAARAVADRTRTSTGAVLLAVTAVVLAELSGRREFGMLLISGNRYSARQQALTTAATQDALMTFLLPDEPLSSTIRRVYKESVTAYRHGSYDPSSYDAMMGETAARIGYRADFGAYFNDARMGTDWAPGSHQDPELLRGESELSLTATYARHDMAFMLVLERSSISLLADTGYIPEAECGDVLLGIEAVLCAAARSDISVRDIPEVFWREFKSGFWAKPEAAGRRLVPVL